MFKNRLVFDTEKLRPGTVLRVIPTIPYKEGFDGVIVYITPLEVKFSYYSKTWGDVRNIIIAVHEVACKNPKYKLARMEVVKESDSFDFNGSWS